MAQCPPTIARPKGPPTEALHPTESGVADAPVEATHAISVDIDPGEIIVLVVRPHWRMLAVDLAPPVVALALIGAAWVGVVPFSAAPHLRAALAVLAIAAVVVAALAALEFRLRLYVLTDKRVIKRSGAMRLRLRIVALPNVASVTQQPNRADARVGALQFHEEANVLGWEYVPMPDRVRKVAEDAIRRYGHHRGNGA